MRDTARQANGVLGGPFFIDDIKIQSLLDCPNGSK